ncbi:hypothetical protein AB5I41_24450 [Sphingomonas sp. MMS24-JH45]
MHCGGEARARHDAQRVGGAGAPLAGPSSTQAIAGRPARSHRSAAQAPISSPNIWLISGAVVQSPRC